MSGFALLVALGIGVLVVLYFKWPSARSVVHAIGPHRLTLMHIWRIPAALMFFWYGQHGELPPLLWIVAFRTLCTPKVNADEPPESQLGDGNRRPATLDDCNPSIAVVIAVTLTSESMTASCQPASTQLVTTTDGCRCIDDLDTNVLSAVGRLQPKPIANVSRRKLWREIGQSQQLVVCNA